MSIFCPASESEDAGSVRIVDVSQTPSLDDIIGRKESYDTQTFSLLRSSIAYWTPQDPATKDNTLIYILAHESREAARKNWSEFGADPEWREVVKASEADGKIVEKVDSSFMDPTDYSPIK